MFCGSVIKDIIKQVAYEEPRGSILFSRNKSYHVELVILTTFLLFFFLLGFQTGTTEEWKASDKCIF